MNVQSNPALGPIAERDGMIILMQPSTKHLLVELMKYQFESRFVFRVEPGTGITVVQRMRVMFSRVKASVRKLGRGVHPFMIKSEVEHTKYCDVVSLWRRQKGPHITEEFKEMLRVLAEMGDLE